MSLRIREEIQTLLFEAYFIIRKCCINSVATELNLVILAVEAGRWA